MVNSDRTLIVDFNRADDDDVVWALRKSSAPEPGSPVELRDREGNRCLGYVVRFDADRVFAQMAPGTWMDAEPVKILDQSTALDEALAGYVGFVRPQAEITR